MYKDFLYLMDEKSLTFSKDGVEALMRCLCEKYDLILLDYKMPRMNGVDLLTVLRGTGMNKETPIVMISGEMGTFDVAPELLQETYFLPKPITYKKLDAMMTSIRH